MADPSATPTLFDRALLLQRQNRARKLEPATFLLDRVREDMAERLSAVKRDFADAADIWTPDAGFSPSGPFKSFHHIAPAVDEAVPLAPASLDLALSALAFQFVNDLPGVLAQIRRALKPDELLLAHEAPGDSTVGYWRFEQPDVFKDSSANGHNIRPDISPAAQSEPGLAALTDFCHVLLNSSEFLYSE